MGAVINQNKTLSRKYFSALIAAIDHSLLISITDTSGTILYVSRRFAEVSQYDTSELIGMNHRVLSSGAHSGDTYDDLWKTVTKGRACRGNIKNRAKDGSYYCVDMSIVPAPGADGTTERYVSVSIPVGGDCEADDKDADTFERLSSDLAIFKLAVESASDHIVITDNAGTIIYANKAAEQITGFKKSEMLGKKVGTKELWGGQMSKAFYKSLWTTIAHDKQPFVGEFTNRRKDGELYISRAGIAPIFNDEGEVTFYVGIERDITSEKRVERAKDEFLSLASHQLRTPLTAVRWYLESLKDESIAGAMLPTQKDIVAKIDEASLRMIELVSTLLDVARAEAGHIIVRPKSTNIKRLSDSIMQEALPVAKQKQQQLHLRIETEHVGVTIDRSLVSQVIQNLLSNAVKYSPSDTNITLIVSDASDGCLQFAVTDHGYGIPSAQQHEVFDKFFRADNVVEAGIAGSGLGLYLVKSITDVLGGKVWFSSTLNKGTTFYFTVPLHKSKNPTKGKIDA